MKNSGISGKQLTSSLIKTEQVVGALRKLPAGWGGQDTKKPAPKAINKTKKVLSQLENGRMPWPVVCAVPAGGVLLTWGSMTRDIKVNIDIDGDIQFLTYLKRYDHQTETVHQMESEGTIPTLEVIDHMMVWFMTDKAHAA